MSVGKRSGGRFSALARLLVVFAFFIGSLCANSPAAHAQVVADPLTDQAAEDGTQDPLDAGGFHFNDHDTTPFGPAYADIWLTERRPDLGIFAGQECRLRYGGIVKPDILSDRQVCRMHDGTVLSYREKRQRRQRIGPMQMPRLRRPLRARAGRRTVRPQRADATIG